MPYVYPSKFIQIYSSQTVMEMAARAIAYIAVVSKTLTAELVEGTLNKAYEWLALSDSKNADMARKQAAAVVLSPNKYFISPITGDAVPGVRIEDTDVLLPTFVALLRTHL